jgi:hypothetical protein
VAGARARLAELEADYTKEKSRVDATLAILFPRLREHYQKRDRLRLIVDYQKFLDSFVRGGNEEAKQAGGKPMVLQSPKTNSRYSPGWSEFTAADTFSDCRWILGQLVVGKTRMASVRPRRFC